MVSEWMVYIAQQPVRCTPFLGRHSATEIKWEPLPWCLMVASQSTDPLMMASAAFLGGLIVECADKRGN